MDWVWSYRLFENKIYLIDSRHSLKPHVGENFKFSKTVTLLSRTSGAFYYDALENEAGTVILARQQEIEKSGKLC